MKNIKSLVAAGTVATALSVSAFLLPASVFGATISNITDYCDAMTNGCSLPAGDYTLGADIYASDKYIDVNGAVSINFAGHTITTQTINVLDGGELTLSGDGGVNGALSTEGVLIINGGNYVSNFGTALNVRDNAVVNISGGNFTANDVAAVGMFVMANPAKLTITGGTFTSNLHFGIEIGSEVGTSEVKISGGTFQGKETGLTFYGAASELKLSGGTFKAGASGMGAIAMPGTDTSVLNSLLASGYKYSDATASAITSGYGNNVILTAKEVIVQSATASTTPTNSNTTTTPSTPSESKQKMLEEMSKEMEKVIASSSSKSTKKATTTTAKKAVKAPDTGAVAE